MKQGLHFGKLKEVAKVAKNQLLHRLFFTSSPWNADFCNSLIIRNNVPRTCVQRVSETFAEKVVQNAIAGMVQRCRLQSLALRWKAVSACNCKGYKKKIARDFVYKSLAINKFWWRQYSFLKPSKRTAQFWPSVLRVGIWFLLRNHPAIFRINFPVSEQYSE